ncbi:hypothetical protein PG994_001828 [Apiospora phragmitis]|uniref:CS domain-containing protein n=1 Tax=Apiospora phragmitis TaxID=2905665 RepID=A0ABR1WUN7_9PEZI
MSQDMLTPQVLWAQRSSNTDPEKNFIYLTIVVPDVKKDNLKLDLKSDSLNFQDRHVENSKINHTSRNIEIKLRKKELKEEYWPRLLKESKKLQFLKTDFDKWVDEDEQNEAPEEDFSNFGGMGGMPGMGGAGGGDFGGIDFSKLGGGAAPMGEEEEDEDEEEDDDDMPALEGEEDASADKGKTPAAA